MCTGVDPKVFVSVASTLDPIHIFNQLRQIGARVCPNGSILVVMSRIRTNEEKSQRTLLREDA
jgi:hypothetical protein